MDESEHDCEALGTDEFFDFRPRKHVFDFSDLPRIGDDLNLPL